MLVVQPPLIGKYFTGKQKQIDRGFYKSFFLSWEDALWHILNVHNVKKGAVIILPEFFCGNVITHMQEHGLKVVTYSVDKYLVPDSANFQELISKIQPRIVVIFHAVGIQNILIKNHKHWLSKLSPETILIEDCVHKVINPKDINTKDVRFITKNHYFVDSLRKVIPVQGSFVYSLHRLPKISYWQNVFTLPYKLGVLFFWTIMQVNLVLAYYSKHIILQKLFNYVAEHAMQVGYNLIGSSRLPSSGILLMSNLYNKVNKRLIYKSKITQAKIYKKSVTNLLDTGNFWLPKFTKKDHPDLRGFPLIMNLTIANKFLSYMRGGVTLIRFELNDSEWSNKQKIVYLPMGLHVGYQDLNLVIKMLNNFKS